MSVLTPRMSSRNICAHSDATDFFQGEAKATSNSPRRACLQTHYGATTRRYPVVLVCKETCLDRITDEFSFNAFKLKIGEMTNAAL